MDIIYNVEQQYVKKVNIGLFGICEIPNEEIFNKFSSFEYNIFLETQFNQYLSLKNKKKYIVESENIIRTIWLCKILTFEQVLEQCDLKNIVKSSSKKDIETVPIIYGRCLNSMNFLDKVYRDYVYRHKFVKNQIIAIKSVAGSGKTTTLLELSKIHVSKKILYIAFNKSLITEIKEKIASKDIRNLIPTTFDALMRDVFIKKTNVESPDIFDLKPQNLPDVIEWFVKKPYRIKNFYVKNFSKFCNQTKYSDIKLYSEKVLGGEKKLLTKMWEEALKFELITFDTIRKLVELNHWCKNYIDEKYDMIFIDESQDFDNTMLKILLEDTTIPKLFVGDTRQAIYEWKGCINAFEKLPENSLIIEFYSTFRVGTPACEEIREKFENCWMISKSKNVTHIRYDIIPTEKYVYLFRSWRSLMLTAQALPNIWIHSFQSQIYYIKRLHSRLQTGGIDEDELNEFSDDLPKSLSKLSVEDLEKIITDIENNIVKKEDCFIEMYTIHSYKGLESDIVRIYNDIDVKKETNLHYVALTRGMKEIIVDIKIPIYDDNSDGKKQTHISKFIKPIKNIKMKINKKNKDVIVLDDFSNSED